MSLTVHEFSHALLAFLQGDTTAQRMGRLTLNPIAHIDPIGTVLVPLLGAMSGFPLIGWAKPVPFNPYNLRKGGRWGSVYVALAGPLSNFVMALVFLGLLRLSVTALGLSGDNLLVMFLTMLVMINVVLGIFNFIPVPPLDGSKLMHAILDAPKYRNFLITMETRGPMILMILILVDFALPVSILGTIFGTAINLVFSLGGL
ncbi:site-2 protease family protein [Patescibacteria group bacterium]|nr:site-2 protease family protein [Patescibacteria group bacterium]